MNPHDQDLCHELAQLRRSHPRATALELLDLALFEHTALPLEPAATDPTTALGREIADAFDPAMSPEDWDAWAGSGADCYLRSALLALWNDEILPRFAARYGSEARPAGPQS